MELVMMEYRCWAAANMCKHIGITGMRTNTSSHVHHHAQVTSNMRGPQAGGTCMHVIG